MADPRDLVSAELLRSDVRAFRGRLIACLLDPAKEKPRAPWYRNLNDVTTTLKFYHSMQSAEYSATSYDIHDAEGFICTKGPDPSESSPDMHHLDSWKWLVHGMDVESQKEYKKLCRWYSNPYSRQGQSPEYQKSHQALWNLARAIVHDYVPPIKAFFRKHESDEDCVKNFKELVTSLTHNDTHLDLWRDTAKRNMAYYIEGVIFCVIATMASDYPSGEEETQRIWEWVAARTVVGKDLDDPQNLRRSLRSKLDELDRRN